MITPLNILNKLSPEAREQVIQLEAQIAEKRQEINNLDALYHGEVILK